VSAAVAFELPAVREGALPVVFDAHPRTAVVLNFFAAWCDPCHAELPLLARAASRPSAASSVEFLGVDYQDNRSLAVELLDQSGVHFPTGYDPDTAVSRRWGIDGLPITVFIAPGGRVVDFHRGQLTQGQLDRRLAQLVRGS
jgi:cytochrome c biogenesis protein CcmG/thiol:disulfide interchange protein DsbE